MEEGMDGRPLNMSQSRHLAITKQSLGHSALALLRRFDAASPLSVSRPLHFTSLRCHPLPARINH